MDIVIQALSGAMYTSGEHDHPPVRIGVPMADMLAPVFAVIGILSGRQQQIDVTSIFSANVTVAGISVGSRAMFEAMNRAIETHRIVPLISATFGCDAISKAYAALAAAGHMGKIALRA